MKISKFNVNRSKSDFCFKHATFVSDGLMSADDHILLHSLKEMSGKNIEQINVVGPDMTELSPKFEEAKEKLAEQETTLERLYYLTESQGYCGRVWDESSASPVAKTYCGNLTMLQNLPELLGLGGYLVQNDHTRRKLSKENHYFFEDGTEAKLDGSMGHYQWGWNRPFYITTWNENNLFFECISFEPIKGRESYYVPVGSMSAAGFAALDRDTNTLVSYCNDDSRYRGGNNTTAWDNDSVKTLLGRCATYKTTTAFAAAARKNGQGWYAGTMRMNAVVQVLFHIIMGTRNSQDDFNPVKNLDGLYECGLGEGVSGLFECDWDVWDTYNSNNPFLSMSECVELGDYTGVSNVRELNYKDTSDQDKTDIYTIPIFFGLKHPFGYIWRASEDEFGISNNDMNMIHYIRKSLYSEDYVYGTINDAVIRGGATPVGNGWIKELSFKNLEIWPIVCGASDQTYYSDILYYYNPATSAKRAVFRGSLAYDKAAVGISVVLINSNINRYDVIIGSPLCEFTEDFLLEPIIS